MYDDYDSRAASARYEAWDADADYADDDDWEDDDAEWEDDDPDADPASRALAVVNGEVLPERTAPFIIPGGGMLVTKPTTRRRKRPLTMQLMVLSVTACLVVSALFSVGAIGVSAASDVNPFALIANSFINVQQTATYHTYYAQPGDTFDVMAQKFGVQVNGIFELNNLYLDAAVRVGQGYKISYDPNYGRNYQPRYPPGVNPTGYQKPDADIIIKASSASQFAAVAAQTNPNNYCPPGYGAWGGNPALYGFINFDQPKTGPYHSVITQRFWSGHDGVDISTGEIGTDVYAAQMGVVLFAGWDIGGGGYTIKIAHCGYVATSYAHLVPGSMKVKAGDKVTQGELIGLQGVSGDAYGAHVHFMLWWDNIPVDGICGYPNGLDGHTVAGEGSIQYNGCPPNLQSLTPFNWG
jgi:murein DD-endopeptidase MepM/ murein hydrolase activator NlpD